MKWLLLAAVVITAVLGDLCQSHEMKEEGEERGGAPGLMRVIRLIAVRRYLVLSMVAMAISFFAFMALLRIAPLSFAVPASAASFILETALAKLWLGERIGIHRGAGALLVFCGILLISR